MNKCRYCSIGFFKDLSKCEKLISRNHLSAKVAPVVFKSSSGMQSAPAFLLFLSLSIALTTSVLDVLYCCF